MSFEGLESRRLMSVSLNPAGPLTVLGKNDADPLNGDVIDIWVSGTSLFVNDNGVVSSFPVIKVKNISVFLQAGNDTVIVAPSVKVNCLLDSGTATNEIGDEMQGGSGNDTLVLRSDFGVARGGAGNDKLQNLGGLNVLAGQEGDDLLQSMNGGTTDSRYDGGSGRDTMDYSAATVDLLIRSGSQSGEYIPGTSPLILNGATFPDFVDNMQHLFGGSGDDYIFGNNDKNTLRGNGGNDVISGGGNNDIIYGGPGQDYLFGDAGNDVFYSKDNVKDFVFGGSGTDTANKDAVDILNSVEGSF